MPDNPVFRLQTTIRIIGLTALHCGSVGTGHTVRTEGTGPWELVYLQSGEAELATEKCAYILRAGQLLMHHPGGPYPLVARCESGARVFTLAFSSNSPALRLLRGQCFTLTPAQRTQLACLIAECVRVFGPLPGLDSRCDLTPRESAPRGSQQRIGVTLTQVLLALLTKPAPRTDALPMAEDGFAPLFRRTRELMCASLDGSLRFTQVCRAVGLSATVFKERFQRHTGLTVMDYYRRLRIEEARRRLREGDGNIAQVADELGYSSAAAFSRQFRQVMRITPSEYLRSVRGQAAAPRPGSPRKQDAQEE